MGRAIRHRWTAVRGWGWVLCTIIVALGSVALAQDAEPERRAVLEARIETRLAEYAATFPELRFVLLSGPPEAVLPQLRSLLGPTAVNLDYEHPDALRAALMDLSLARIRTMLEVDAPSASLLRPDEDEPHPLCVMTVEPCAVARDDRTATCHFLDLPPGRIGAVPRERYLPCEAYLDFVLDHELYHCLDSWHHGPQPMSFAEHWGEYWQFRRENGADAFAMARYLQRRGEAGGRFAANFGRIRDWSALRGDPDHWTGRSLSRVEAAAEALIGMDAQDTFAWVGRLREAVVGEERDYLVYRASVAEAMRRAGHRPAPDVPDPDVDFDPELVEDLLSRSRQADRALGL